MKYTTISYDRGSPQVRMQRVISGLSPIPTPPPPPPPTPPVTVTGEVRLEGIPLSSPGVTFSGVGAFTSDLSGTYVGTVASGYSGNASLAWLTGLPQYAVTPTARVYVGLLVNQAGQDFDIDINFLNLSGFILSSGTGVAAQITNGTRTWTTAANGSYGYYVPYGWSGSTAPVFYGTGSFSPFSYTYGPVGVDHPDQNFSYTPPPVLISGELRLDGTAFSSITVNFSGDGQGTSDFAGTYSSGTLVSGYSGTASVLAYAPPAYIITPTARVYSGLSVSQAGQDFDIATQLWSIDGVITNDGTGIAIGINNGTNFWTSAANGSYGLVALGGWSGTVRPTTYFSAPDAYTYTSIGTDYTAQDFDVPTPVLLVADSYMSWASWPLALPDRWFVIAKNPVDFALSVWGTTAGTITAIETAPDYGTYYSVYGVNNASAQNTFRSNEQYSSAPLPPLISLNGSVFDVVYGTGFSQNLYVDTVGTINTDGAGLWIQSVTAPYTGYVYPVDIPVDGTFQPPYRSYVGYGSEAFNQDFVLGYPSVVLSGVTTWAAGTGFGAKLAIGSYGTIRTDTGNGSYSVSLPYNFTGTVLPLVEAVTGTYTPSSRGYAALTASQSGQNYDFVPTPPPPPPPEVLSVTRIGNTERAVAVSGTYAVFVGASGQVFTTHDGVDFTNQTSGVIRTLRGIAYDGSLYVAASLLGKCITSADGTNWTVQADFAAFPDWNASAVVHNGTQFYLAADSGQIQSSPDGVTWTVESTLAGGFCNAMIWDGARFVALDNNVADTYYLSADGTNWSTFATGVATGQWSSIVYNSAGTYAMISSIGDASIVRSTDGTNWTLATTQPNNTDGLASIAYGNGYYVLNTSEAVGNVWYSTDANNWLLWPEEALDGLFKTFYYTGLKFFVSGDPLTPIPYQIAGQVTDAFGPLNAVAVEFTASGTASTDAFGTYSQNVVPGYSGTAIPHSSTGTFIPTERVYTSVATNIYGQDYFFQSYPFYVVTGVIRLDGVPTAGISVTFPGDGQGTSDVNGTYTGTLILGYSGSATVLSYDLPTYTTVPTAQVYTSLVADQYGRDYSITTVSTDCPVVSTLAVIPIDATPKNPSRNVIDPVNNLLWVIDESYDGVYYLDVVAGTYAGSVNVNATFGSPCIAYDATNQKVVVTTYDGSLAFINPVTKAVTFSNFVQSSPNFHMLAVDQYGTVYVCDNRNTVTGSLYVVDGATEQLLASYHLGPQGVSSDSICWAENINRLVLNSNGFGASRFHLFDTNTGNFSASVLTNSAVFCYENYYVKGTGNVLMSQDGASAVSIIDIAAGTDATILGVLAADINDGAPTRAGDVTEDTCANTLFVSDGNYGVWEYTMDGSYTLLNVFDNGYLGLNPTGLAHSRATNQVYYENYVDGTTYSLPYAQYPISGFVHEAGTGIANAAVEFSTFGTQSTDANGTYFLIVPVEWSGTVTPHLAAGTFVPLNRVYTSVAAAQTNQDFEYFWGGYLFLTLGTSGFFFPSLAADAVVVDGTIVQLNNDGYVYTSTQGRTDWTLRGFPSIGGRIAYSDSLQRYIVAGGGGAIWEAEDLSVWYGRTSGAEPNALTSVAAGGNRFVAVGVDGNASMSTDGTNWTATFAGSQQLTDVYYDGAQFVATGVANIVYTTADGTAWTLRATSPQNTWKAGAYSPELGLHVIIGINGATTSGAIATSTDGTNWTDITGVIPTAETLNGIAWGSNRFVVTDSTGVLWTSSNGTAWDYVTEDPYGKIGRRVEYWKNDWFVICEEEPGS